jgi:type II secretory pathway component PulF
MLLHAGIPMLDALDTISEQNQGSFRTAILGVRDRVAAGSSLAEALRGRPDLFDAASVHMVEVGENSGTLDSVLEQLAEFKRKQLSLRDSVTTALVYPLFLICFGTAAALFLMTSVLPPLLDNLQETLDVLPWPTRVARSMSDALLSYGWLIAIVVAVSVVAVLALLRTDKGKEFWHRTLLRLPLIGPMATKQGVARIAMIIGTLSRSGVELTRAVELAERSTGNVIFKKALKQCGDRIAAGEEVADALRQSGAFPPLAVRVFSVGQESGKLDEMLFRLADDYDAQVATASARLTALLEPALILVLAAMVGFLLLATILPILEAGNVM